MFRVALTIVVSLVCCFANAATIEGVVVDQAGQPVKNAQISVSRLIEKRQWRREHIMDVMTNEQGRFVIFLLPPGKLYSLNVMPPGGPPRIGAVGDVREGETRQLRGVIDRYGCGIRWESPPPGPFSFTWPPRSREQPVLICEG